MDQAFAFRAKTKISAVIAVESTPRRDRLIENLQLKTNKERVRKVYTDLRFNGQHKGSRAWLLATTGVVWMDELRRLS